MYFASQFREPMFVFFRSDLTRREKTDPKTLTIQSLTERPSAIKLLSPCVAVACSAKVRHLGSGGESIADSGVSRGDKEREIQILLFYLSVGGAGTGRVAKRARRVRRRGGLWGLHD